MPELDPRLRKIARVLAPVYLFAIYGLPSGAVATLWLAAPSDFARVAAATFAPVIFATLMAATAGTLSRAHQKGIVPGKFPRDTGHPVYFHRRLYGLCWTTLYYCKPVYAICLALPWLKTVTFRLFGYRGQMDFTVYPDTWIRDLPLLTFGKGAYIANRATLGTNLALRDGRIQVGVIEIGERTVIGHLCAMAPDCRFGRDSELGAMSGLGYKNQIGDNVSINPHCSIEHGVRIGSGCQIGTTSYVGSASQLPEGTVVPPGAVVPPRTRYGQTRDQQLSAR